MGLLESVKEIGNNRGVRPKVSFGACSNSNGLITPLNYNRCVAQTMMIALNAEELGTPRAFSNAQSSKTELEELTDQLHDRLLQPDINELCVSSVKKHSLRMHPYKEIIVTPSTNYVRRDCHLTSNVFVAPGTLPANIRDHFAFIGEMAQIKAEPPFINLPTNLPLTEIAGLNSDLAFTTTVQKTHLLDLSEYKSDQGLTPHSIPNSMLVESKCAPSPYGGMCAAIFGSSGVSYPAGIPGGYIRISYPRFSNQHPILNVSRKLIGHSPAVTCSLHGLLKDANVSIVDDMIIRIHQIAPLLTDLEIERLLRQPLPPCDSLTGTVFLCLKNETLVLTKDRPDFYICSDPDGNPKKLSDKCTWTASSGYGNLLGALQFH